MQHRPPPYAASVPGPSITAPRDGVPLNQSRDVLFLAVLHERSRATGWVVGERGLDGIRHYHACPPPADPQGRKGGPVYLSSKTLRHRLVRRSGLFDIRVMCQDDKPPGGNLTIGTYRLCRDGKWDVDENMKWYLECAQPLIEIGSPDVMITSLPTMPLFSWCDLTAPEPAKAVNGGDWVCPNCGLLSTVEAVWTSPARTWAGNCGRCITHTLCVVCLLKLDSRRTAMN